MIDNSDMQEIESLVAERNGAAKKDNWIIKHQKLGRKIAHNPVLGGINNGLMDAAEWGLAGTAMSMAHQYMHLEPEVRHRSVLLSIKPEPLLKGTLAFAAFGLVSGFIVGAIKSAAHNRNIEKIKQLLDAHPANDPATVQR